MENPNMNDYIHRVQYYETDQMAVVHHSNYIRWMEEARVEFLDRHGIGFVTLEARGILSPVVGVECRYRRPTRFDERIRVHVELREYTGVRLRVEYEMYNDQSGELVSTGASTHCFTNMQGRPISLQRDYPDVDAVLAAAVIPAKQKDE
jgi:acyl-CoA thioester hydrolase